MYLEHFNLKEAPFQLTPDSDFLYLSKAHSRAKAYMDHTVWNKDGFVVITGDVGCGKTTLIQKLLTELGDSVLVAKIFQTQLDEVEFLQALLVEFGMNPFNAKKVELMDMLNTFMINAYSQFKQIILIVDEAQNLSVKVLEEIRLLAGLETQKEKILNVILVGQPELNENLQTPEMEQLLQRVRLRFHIGPLKEGEIGEYVKHRLNVAGASNREIFTGEAIKLISEYTGGVPRLINTLCDTSMICAFADNEEKVGKGTVTAAVKELQWESYEKRMASKGAAEKNRESNRKQIITRKLMLDTSGNQSNDPEQENIESLMSAMNERLESIDSVLKLIAENITGKKSS